MQPEWKVMEYARQQRDLVVLWDRVELERRKLAYANLKGSAARLGVKPTAERSTADMLVELSQIERKANRKLNPTVREEIADMEKFLKTDQPSTEPG
jgi:hypothetical protein